MLSAWPQELLYRTYFLEDDVEERERLRARRDERVSAAEQRSIPMFTLGLARYFV